MTSPSETVVRTSEAGHWYWPSGLPAYEVEAKDGTKRAATLRDARKLGLYPSVTTIIKAAAQPGLEVWKQRQVMLAALTLSRVDGETDDAFVARVLDDSKEQARSAADLGTGIHAAIQNAYDDQPVTEHMDIVAVVRERLDMHFGSLAWPLTPERSFAHPLGYGGKVDLHNPLLVCDVKTKAFADAREVGVYDEHLMQLAAYRVGLGFPYARCANVFVSTTTPGLVWVKEHRGDDLARGWEMFVALLHFWQSRTGHRPSYPGEAA